MTSHDLAKMLLEIPAQPVLSWCPDENDWMPVTGFTYSGLVPGTGAITLYNDDDGEE